MAKVQAVKKGADAAERLAEMVDEAGKLAAEMRVLDRELKRLKRDISEALAASGESRAEGERYTATLSFCDIREIKPADLVRYIEDVVKPGSVAARSRILNDTMSVGLTKVEQKLGRGVRDTLNQLVDVQSRLTIREGVE